MAGNAEYADEDIISVYSFTNHSLIVTRNRFVFVAVDQEVKCNILFEDFVAMREKVEEDCVELCFVCMNHGNLFQTSQDGMPFALSFVEKKIVIGRGHSASRVAGMIGEIIEKEIANHDNSKYCFCE